MARRRKRIYASDREKAIRQQLDQDRAAEYARSAMLTAARRTEQLIMRAFRAGRDVNQALREGMEQQAEILERLSIYAALQGGQRTGQAAVDQKGPIEADQPMTFQTSDVLERGLRFLRNRMLLPESTIAQIGATFAPEVLRVVRNTTLDAQRKMQEAVTDIIAQGLSRREGVNALRQAWNATGLSSSNPYNLETMYRTQSQLAYSAGARSVESDPLLQNVLWGYKYVTAGDARVRPEHAAMDGTTLPKEDAWWDRNMPPNGFNCRCQAIPLYEERAVVEPQRTTTNDAGDTVPVVADEGFRFNVANLPMNAGAVAAG